MQNNNKNKSHIKGDHNIVLQGVSHSHITLQIDGEHRTLRKDLNELRNLLQELNKQTFVLGEKILDIQELSPTSFQNEIKNAIVNSQITVSGNMYIGDVVNYYFNGEKKAIPRLLTNNIPTEAENIIGRDNELQKTHIFLQNHKPTTLVNGMGGIGKTAVATKYIAQHLQDYQHFAWLTVQSSNKDNPILYSIADTFTSNLPLLDSLGITQEINELLQAKAPEQAFQMVFKRLNDLDKTLLVIDNANQLQDLLKHRQLFERSHNCHILITSRTRPDNWQTVEVETLPPQQAIALFRQHHPDVAATDQQIESLLTNLAFHTLLIELVAKSAQKSAIPFEELEDLIEKEYIRSKKLNRRKIDAGAGADAEQNRPKQAKVADYIWFIFRKISHLAPTAKELLRAFVLLPTATFFGEKFLDSFFEVMGLQSEDLYNDLESLVERAWLEKKDFSKEKENPEQKGIQYKIHPLIAEVGVEKLAVEVDFAAKYIQRVTHLIHYDKLNPEHQLIEKNKYTFLAERLSDLFFHQSHESLIMLLGNIGNLEDEYGQYQVAAYFNERALEIALYCYDTDHPIVAVRQSNLASVYLNLGRYPEAANLLEIALVSDLKNFGKDHSRVAVRQSNLANVYLNLGKYPEAANLLEIALVSDIKNFGKDHPRVAVRQSNLANVYGDLGRYVEAANLLETALASDLKNFRNNHPEVANKQSNLATVYGDLGRYAEAANLLQIALDSDIKNFGKDHPTVAVSQSNLANVYLHLGRYAEAAGLLEIALASNLKNFGKDHPTVAVSQSNLANVYNDLGRYAEAASLLEIALASAIKNFGKDHPNVAVSQSNLATVYLHLGRYAEAAGLLEIALASNLKNFGKDHPTVAGSQSNLATVYLNLGRYAEAAGLLEIALASAIKNFGKDHPNVAVSQSNLGMVYFSTNEYEKAIPLLQDAYDLYARLLGEEHPNTQTIGENLQYAKMFAQMQQMGLNPEDLMK
ncbi:MAG: tetratricopeptide repeat protein [Chitinophagales bacterium]